jgi:diguanylate cyclase (GGDEF)-like protein
MLIRAPRRLVALLALVCVLAGCKHSQERAVSVSKIVTASDRAPITESISSPALPSADPSGSFLLSSFTLALDSPQSISVIKLGQWWDTHRITSFLFLIVAIALAASLWAALLRREVEARTRELRSSIAAKRKAQEFDIARNQVLEAIVRNAPPPESMERLALAVQEQIDGALCAIAMSPDGKSFLKGRPSVVLIAPDLPEELQREMLPVLSSVLVSSAHAEQSHLKSDHEVMTNLLQISHRTGLDLKDGRVMMAVSGSGELAGLLMVFSTDTRLTDAGSAARSVLESALRLVSLSRDHWHMHERLVFDARHDPLTGLPNRALAEDRLEQALARAQRRKQLFAVLCIDLDGFKAINDSLGHYGGDELLRVISVRLRARIRHSDTLARIGGDEFLAIIEACSGDSAAQSVAESLIAALQEPVTIEGQTVAISGSIGVAIYPADGQHATELKRNADEAMYRAKSRSGNQICFWSGEPAGAGKAMKTASP